MNRSNRGCARCTLLLGALLAVAPAAAMARTVAVPLIRTPAMYELLGMADEYMSRFDFYKGTPRPGFVEQFYPKEAQLAEAYVRLIRALEKESGRRFKVERKLGPQGHIELRSDALAAAINAHYVKVDGRTATLDRAALLRAPQAQLLRYLRGAYARYGRNNTSSLRMANAPHKIETLGHVLKKLGCADVVIYATKRTIPGVFEVHFRPSPTVRKALPIKAPARDELSKSNEVDVKRL